MGQPKYPESSNAEPWELLCKDIRNITVSKDFNARNFAAMFVSVRVVYCQNKDPSRRSAGALPLLGGF